MGRFLCVTHPFAALIAQLACLKPITSIHSEPGSNSSVSKKPLGKSDRFFNKKPCLPNKKVHMAFHGVTSYVEFEMGSGRYHEKEKD